MTRRELAKKTIGALFGVSVIPAAFEKPAFQCRTTNFKWPPITREMMEQWKSRAEMEDWIITQAQPS